MALGIKRPKNAGVIGPRGGQKVLRAGLILRLQGQQKRRLPRRLGHCGLGAGHLEVQPIKRRRKSRPKAKDHSRSRGQKPQMFKPQRHQGSIFFRSHSCLSQLAAGWAIGGPNLRQKPRIHRSRGHGVLSDV